MMGVFCALDFFLFYVFWEVMLLPMYFLIGIWGGPRRSTRRSSSSSTRCSARVLLLVAILRPLLHGRAAHVRHDASSARW